MTTPFLSALLAILRKDLQIEFRSRELVASMLLFALLCILIFSFALELDRVARDEAVSGVLWVTVVFASTIGLNRSMALEREQGNLDALLIAPIARGALLAGKLAANLIFALTVGLSLMLVMSILYNKPLLAGWLLLVLALGTLGLATVGTLLAAMTVQTRTRESLLPIVMLPVILPVLLAAVRATTGILNQQPFADWASWLNILLVLDVLYLALSYLLFAFVVED